MLRFDGAGTTIVDLVLPVGPTHLPIIFSRALFETVNLIKGLGWGTGLRHMEECANHKKSEYSEVYPRLSQPHEIKLPRLSWRCLDTGSVAGKSRRYGMAPAPIPVFLSQKPSTRGW